MPGVRATLSIAAAAAASTANGHTPARLVRARRRSSHTSSTTSTTGKPSATGRAASEAAYSRSAAVGQRAGVLVAVRKYASCDARRNASASAYGIALIHATTSTLSGCRPNNSAAATAAALCRPSAVVDGVDAACVRTTRATAYTSSTDTTCAAMLAA